MLTKHRQKTPAQAGWHAAEIKCELEKLGKSLAHLSRTNRYDRSAASIALTRQWPKMEKIIADALGVPPQTIWPSRYDADGNPITRRRRNSESNMPRAIGQRNVEVAGAK